MTTYEFTQNLKTSDFLTQEIQDVLTYSMKLDRNYESNKGKMTLAQRFTLTNVIHQALRDDRNILKK